MATISFDRKMCVPEDKVDRFIEILEKPAKPMDVIPNIEDQMKEGQRLLKEYLLRR